MAITSVTGLLDSLRASNSALYQSMVSETAQASLQQIGHQIAINDEVRNEFISSLCNKVMETEIKGRMFKNYLRPVKERSTGKVYGNFKEEVFVNPATDKGWDTDGTKLLMTHTPDGKVAYYGINRKSNFPVSILTEEIERAFTSEQAFNSFYNGIVSSLYNADEMAEFLLCKNVMATAIDNGLISMLECDIEKPKELMKNISNASKTFIFPNSTYVPYNKTLGEQEEPVVTYTPVDKQVLYLKASCETEINFEVLATLFHKELAELQAMTVLVDDIPCEGAEIYAVLADADSLIITDKTYKTTSFYNASTMTTNIYLHHWQMINWSSFGNSIAFGKSNA